MKTIQAMKTIQTTAAAVLSLAILGALASACGGSSEKTSASAEPAAKKGAPAETAATKPAGAPGKGAAPAAAAQAEAAPADAVPVEEKAAPGGHSAVPSVAEWNAVTGEVTVRGSTALQCETKGLREWIRVSCRGNHPELGAPTDVTVDNAKGAETFRFASGGVASLVYRFEQGTKVEATFSWEQGSKSFLAEWPPGAPMPTAYGQFL